MQEYVFRFKIDKEDGFVPVFEATKMVESIGAIHKYNALLKVKDGIRDYTMNLLLDDKKKQAFCEWLEKRPEILSFAYNMV